MTTEETKDTANQAEQSVKFLNSDQIRAQAAVIVVLVVLQATVGPETIVHELNSARQNLYVALASAAGSLLGFIIAAIAIILGLLAASTPGMTALRTSKHLFQLPATFFSAARWLGLLLVVAFLGLMIDRDGSSKLFLTYLTALVAAVTAVRVWRCLYFLQQLVNLALPARDATLSR